MLLHLNLACEVRILSIDELVLYEDLMWMLPHLEADFGAIAPCLPYLRTPISLLALSYPWLSLMVVLCHIWPWKRCPHQLFSSYVPQWLSWLVPKLRLLDLLGWAWDCLANLVYSVCHIVYLLIVNVLHFLSSTNSVTYLWVLGHEVCVSTSLNHCSQLLVV